MGLLDNMLSSLDLMAKDIKKGGKKVRGETYKPGTYAPDPKPIDDSVLSRIEGFKPNETLSVDPVPARSA